MFHIRLLPRDMSFFEHFEQATSIMHQAASVLVELMEDYTDIASKLGRLETLEHQGDDTTHAVMKALNKTFITPFDREDISMLSQRLDDVTDLIWAAAERLRIFQIKEIDPSALGMARVLQEQAAVLCRSVVFLREERQMQQILPLTVEINRLENQADDALREGIGRLFQEPNEPADIVLSIKWREIFEFLEQASDKAEDAANVLEGIVIKHA